MAIFGKYNGGKVSLVPYVKHNGAVKIPVSGWTKQNGVLKKVWEFDELVDDEFLKYADGSIEVAHVPYGTTKIGVHAFSGCQQLTSIIIPSTVTTVEEGIVGGRCYSLSSIIFKGTPTSIHENAFHRIDESSAIIVYVPWSEGDVAGAPWGLSFGGIQYNYTE